jgi:putative transcriptional regulator
MGAMADNPGLDVPRPGRLVVANPLLPDPNFDRTVVMLLACGAEGALGLVLNRPSDTGLATPLPGWEQLAAAPPVVFVGGPVQHQAVICLARAPAHAGPSVPPDAWNAVLPEVGTLDLDLDPEGLQPAFSQVRIFAGYAGWIPGQLESEIRAGAWWILESVADDAFSDQPETLWQRVLRRQGGSLALVASYPDDPRNN